MNEQTNKQTHSFNWVLKGWEENHNWDVNADSGQKPFKSRIIYQIFKF